MEKSNPQQVLQEAQDKFEKKFDDLWEHWKFLADFKGGVNFNSFRAGIKSAMAYEIRATLQSFIETEIEHLKGMKKEIRKDLDVYPFLQEVYNQTIDDQISHLKELLLKLEEGK